MPPKAKRPNANQHDRRHETGLAAPGKRINRQRSSGALNGHVISTGKDTSATQAPSSADSNQLLTSSAGIGRAPGGIEYNGSADVPAGTYGEERGRASSSGSLEGSDVYNGINGGLHMDGQQPSPIRRESNGVKAHTSRTASPLTIATTIITACPLRDVIAILIILLQLPPTILAVIQFLFATLTFVPPTSLSALPSVSELLTSAAGNLSLPTMILTDLFVLVIWLVLWVPAQNLALDLAQAVIAISLGGAAYSKGGTTNSVIVCGAIILMSHSFRSKPFRQYGFSLLHSGLFKGNFKPDSDIAPSEWFSDTLYARSSWPRSLLGVHILTQGLVRVIRRHLARREAQHRSQPSNKTDPEAGTTSQASSSSPISNEANQEGGADYCTDGRSPGPSPAGKDGKEKGSGNKKKRKQAKQARTQQPLWAALASIKVTVLKEMEGNHTTADATEADAVDLNHVGNANFFLGEDRVWLSDIEDTEVHFGANLVRRNGNELGIEEAPEAHPVSGIDKSKPFFVRVNGADWSSTRIRHVGSGGCEVETETWSGEIFGLTALSTYRCEFVRTSDNSLLYTVNLLTGPASTAEQASAVTPPAHPPLRPSSPTTTLKNSIAAAEQKLQDYRNRLKRNRKDHKTAVTALRRDVDSLSGRKSSFGGTEDRLKQRELQLQQRIQQAETATSELIAEIEALGDVPKDEQHEADAKKARWDFAKDASAASQADLANAKEINARQVSAARSDASSAAQKHERLQARQTKLAEQRDRLFLAATQDADAHAKREVERATRASQRATIEQQYVAAINAYERQARELTLKVTHGLQAAGQLDSAFPPSYGPITHAHHSSGSSASGPISPEGQLPGTGAGSATAFPRVSASSPFSGAYFSPPFGVGDGVSRGSVSTATGVTAREGGGRARSSSMLSAYSGFTDEATGQVGGGTNGFDRTGTEHERKGSDGSGTGTRADSGSGDATTDPAASWDRARKRDSGQLV